ncbi:L-lactate dehydrogenase [Suttonella sp. R2A3]|uniref:L-lactate dehydrogenase n=1 Tax=Suttonella sp. R2A3 TaxID=2908648 RepID=UPI001F01C680|nr:L-lactate dehydrogenase [Suttonella sp. R2A3]UJF24832.1 L-lactate dehydrogenase [Suttonella sp. R2A3]
MTEVGIVGTGFVGATSAYAIALQGICNELLLIDAHTERARAETADIAHAAALSGTTRVRSGDYDGLRGAKVVVIAAGVNQQPGESRLALLARNAAIFARVVPEIVRVAPQAVVVVATNPVDIMTDITRNLHPHPERVLGTGTLLDTARMRELIGRECGVAARYIHANVLGEHGDSSVLCWDSARIAGTNIAEFMKTLGVSWNHQQRGVIEDKVRSAAAMIIAGKKATYYGIGAAVMKIVDGILRDGRGVYTLSGPSEYGVCLSLPRVLGEDGIVHTVTPDLSDTERQAIQESARLLRNTQEAIEGH